MTTRLTLIPGGLADAPILGDCSHGVSLTEPCVCCHVSTTLRYDELRDAALRAVEVLRDNGASYLDRIAAIEHLETVALRGAS